MPGATSRHDAAPATRGPAAPSVVLERVLVLVAVLGVLAVNALATLLPLNGHTTAELAMRFSERFRPAGYAFSIWSVIYAGLLAFAIFQLLPSQRGRSVLDAVRAPFLVSCAANAAWVFLWHYQLLTATLFAMGVLLLSLIVVNQRLLHPRAAPGPLPGEAPSSRAEWWCVHAPFRVYLAWITVVALANVSTWVEAKGLLPPDISLEKLAIALVIVATLVSVLVGWLRHDALFLTVVVWAFVGIVVRNGPTAAVSGVAMAGILVAVIFVVRALLWRRAQHLHGHSPSTVA